MSKKLRQLTSVEELVGRTIQGVCMVSWLLVINLGDGQFFKCVPKRDYEDDAVLVFDEEGIAPYALTEACIVNAETAKKMGEKQRKETDERMRELDLATLKRLQKKYPEREEQC